MSKNTSKNTSNDVTIATCIPTDATPIQRLNKEKPDDAVKSAIIATLMTSNITRLGGKRMMEIPPELIDVAPEYQRGKRLNQAAEIAANWNDNKYNFPTVSYRNGKLYAVDGQVTDMAAVLAGKTVIGVNVLENITIEEEAKLFDTQDENKSRLKWHEIYKSRLFRKEPDAVALDTVCRKYRLEVTSSQRKSPRRMPSINCALACIARKDLGPDFLDWVFDLMEQSDNWFLGEKTPITNTHINMFIDTYCEGVENNCLAEYSDRFIEVMSHHSPDDFDKLAISLANERNMSSKDARSPTKFLCAKIAHGEFIEGRKPYIITPEETD